MKKTEVLLALAKGRLSSKECQEIIKKNSVGFAEKNKINPATGRI